MPTQPSTSRDGPDEAGESHDSTQPVGEGEGDVSWAWREAPADPDRDPRTDPQATARSVATPRGSNRWAGVSAVEGRGERDRYRWRNT